jgi:Fic family protein
MKNETEAINNYIKVSRFVRNYNSTLISEQFIKNIHLFLMRGLKAKGGRSIEAGKYRKDNKLKDIAFNLCLPEVIEERDSNNKIQRT